MVCKWDNQPSLSELRSGCSQEIHCGLEPEPQPELIQKFLSSDHVLSVKNPSQPFSIRSVDGSASKWLFDLLRILYLCFEHGESLPESQSFCPKIRSSGPTDTSKRLQVGPPTLDHGKSAVSYLPTPTKLITMSGRRSAEALFSFSPLPNGRHLLGPVSKSEVEAYEWSLPPSSAGSSSLSSPPDSDDLSDPFQKETVGPKRQALKRTIDQANALGYERPTTRAATKSQVLTKKRKVHFQAADTDAKSRRSADCPPLVLLPGLDPLFGHSKESIFAKSDSSGKQKAWVRKYLFVQRDRMEAIQTLKSALRPDLEGSRSSTPASFVSNPPSKRGRGSGRRGRGRGGRGGRGRGGGRTGRNGDSPEPPKKKIMSEAEREVLAELRARQNELKKFFKEVGAQQNEVLTLLATRDLGKIVKKSKAHERVGEHQILLDALSERRKEAEEFARRKYQYELKQAETLLEAEKEVIEQRYKTRCTEAKSEHHLGARKDYLIARKAIPAMMDENVTEPGSPNATQLPRLHTFAEHQIIRGYSSQHITDETSLQRPPSSPDEATHREVSSHGIILPTLSKTPDVSLPGQAEDTSHHGHMASGTSSTSLADDDDIMLGMQALTAEAARRLQEDDDLSNPIDQAINSHPHPALPAQPDPALSSWPLSRLADAAENELSRMQLTQSNQMFAPRVLPATPYKPCFATMALPPARVNPPPQSMPPSQWPSSMRHMPRSTPPVVASQVVSPSTTTNYEPSHPLPPPPPPPPPTGRLPPQLQPPPVFMRREDVPMTPYRVEQQGQYSLPEHQPLPYLQPQHPPSQYPPLQHPQPPNPPPQYPPPQHLEPQHLQPQHPPLPNPPPQHLPLQNPPPQHPPPQHPPPQHPPPQHPPPQHPPPQHPPLQYPPPQHLQPHHPPPQNPPSLNRHLHQPTLPINPSKSKRQVQRLPSQRSQQQDRWQQIHLPFTFVNQTIVPPAPATTATPAKAKKRPAADGSNQRNNHNDHHHPRIAAGGGGSGEGGGGGGGGGFGVARPPPPPPPKGGHRILLPKSG